MSGRLSSAITRQLPMEQRPIYKKQPRGSDRTDRPRAGAEAAQGRWECVAARRMSCEQITPEESHEPREILPHGKPDRSFASHRDGCDGAGRVGLRIGPDHPGTRRWE